MLNRPSRAASAALVLVLLPCAAGAAGWSPPEARARLEGVSVSNAFPGYVNSAADRGIEAEASLASDYRAEAVKLGLEAHAGAMRFERFAEAGRAWLGAELSARRGGTQFVIEPEWTPKRVKFPAVPEDAEFRRVAWRFGVRQSLAGGVRARVEARLHDDDYIPAFDARDARVRGGFARLDWSPSAALSFRIEGEVERTRTTNPKHSHDDHAVTGALTWHAAGWTLGGGLRSGVSRYVEARPSDSNYRRRDQWLEPTARIGRTLPGGLEAMVALNVNDQTSSRLDRAYTVQQVRAGFAWTSPTP